MNICLGFFGFTRQLINHEMFINFIKLLPNGSNIDIFISCPSKLDEIQTGDEINDVEFKTHMANVFKDCPVFINTYKYNPHDYIQKTRILEIPDYITTKRIYSFRILSLHFSISLLSNIIYDYTIKENKNYDKIILTRFDIFPTIESFGDCLTQTLEPTIHIWRTCPYKSSTDAEDRVIITNILGLEKIRNLYTIYDNLNCYRTFSISNNDFYSEHIIGTYLKSFDNIVLLPQDNIRVGLSSYRNVKYSNDEHFKKLIGDYIV